MLTTGAAARLREQLLRIPELAAYAYLDLAPSSTRSSGMPSGSRTAPLPAREDVLSLFGPAAPGDVHDVHRDQTGPVPVQAVLSTWCELVTGRRCTNITTACSLLLDHHQEAVQAEYAQAYATDIGDLHHRLDSLAGVYQRPVSIRCPRCNRRSLTISPGRGYECADHTCGVILRDAELDRRVDEQLAPIYAEHLKTQRQTAEPEPEHDYDQAG